MELKGKKMLILGANAETIPIVKRAQEMGVVVFVTDHIKTSAAKKVADGSYDINGKDVNGIVEIFKRDGFDGILLGVADPLAEAYVKICEELKIPCMVDKNSIALCSNKTLFKDECRKAGINTVKEFFSVTDLINAGEKDKVEYHIVIKPAISRGGNGVCLCRNVQQMNLAFEKAKQFSENSEVIGEEYIEADDCVATFLVLDGETHLVAMSDRILLKNKEGLATVTYSNQFPSKYTKLFQANELERYKVLFNNLNIQNGIFNIQMFKKGIGFVPYDSDCIINGECSSKLIAEVYGIDVIGGWIEYVLNGKREILQQGIKKLSVTNGVGASVWISLNEGILCKIEGKKEVSILPQVVESLWRLKEGVHINAEMVGCEHATLARIWVKDNDRELLQKDIDIIRKKVLAYDEENNYMILN